jgi:hypothetical protein
MARVPHTATVPPESAVPADFELQCKLWDTRAQRIISVTEYLQRF